MKPSPAAAVRCDVRTLWYPLCQRFRERSRGRLGIIDAAANPSVLSTMQAGFGSRKLSEHNLASLVNVLDIPWIVMDNREAQKDFGWNPQVSIEHLLNEIARHAESNPDWLERSGL